MRSKDTLLRLHRFHVEEKRRQVGDIEMMMADFRRKQDDLDQQIAYEEQKNGVSDPCALQLFNDGKVDSQPA